MPAATPSTQITISAGDLHLGGAPTAVGQSEIGMILGQVYLVAGIVAVVAMVIAGIRYTTSNGDSSQVQAAKNMMFYAIIGLVVIIGAAAITQFVIQSVTKQ